QLKLSWMIALGPEPARTELLNGLEWVSDLFLSVSTPVQNALPRLLSARRSFQARVRERLSENLDLLARLVKSRPAIHHLRAEGGWSAVVRMPRSLTDEAWALELLRRDVVVHPGLFYDFRDEEHLVLSLLPEPAVFASGLMRLGDASASSE
ncbi:MAG TPA: pyridoxal phosphate-dependent aminotransferase, partial [Candidatus Limnocylindria bacterium]|nr:pyridoxal phosphate-dependent aminotransferase [Candidatus Limnocylindria bacterium]